MATFHGHGEPRGFSGDGQLFAYCSSDGRLKIWEVSTGVAKQEYIPSSHLSATCTCLSWAPAQPTHRGAKEAIVKKKKKRKSAGLNTSAVDQPGENSLGNDIIAMGTTAGTVLMYSVAKAGLVSQLTGGHNDRINGLCWSQDGLRLFTCSEDKQIVQWDVLQGTIISKWKVDKGAVYSVLLLPDGNTLVSGGRSIQCWDVSKRKIVNSFVGHASEVWGLFAVPKHSQENATYFLSSAVGDRSISAWRPEGVQNSNAVAAFALQDEPTFADLAISSSDDAQLVLAAVTQTGLLHIFEYQLNGKSRKPLEPKTTIQIASENVDTKSKSAAKLLPVLAAKPGQDGHITMVYGSLVRPSFERLDYRTCDTITSLLRREQTFSHQQVSQAIAMKTRQPEINSDVKVLAPGLVTPGNVGSASDTRKRRLNASGKKAQDELPMELRLADLTIGKAGDATVPPESGNLTHLLMQGLHSKDMRIVQSVLQRTESSVVQGTIRRLPVQQVLPLLVELTKLMQGRTTTAHSYALWLRTLLHRHCAFLSTCPDVQDILTPLMSLMSARTALMPRLGQLQGRLDLLLGQFERRDEKSEEEQDVPQEALLVYQEEPSDVESDGVEDALRNSTSESEDQWDEMSDLEAEPVDVDEDSSDEDEVVLNGNSSEDSEEEGRMSVEEVDENGIEISDDDEEDLKKLQVKSAKVVSQPRPSKPARKSVAKGGRKR